LLCQHVTGDAAGRGVAHHAHHFTVCYRLAGQDLVARQNIAMRADHIRAFIRRALIQPARARA